MVQQYNKLSVNRQGRYQHEAKPGLAHQMQSLGDEEMLYLFFENIFQRMIALMDEIKTTDYEGV